MTLSAIKKVTTNVKGPLRDYDLSPCTAIVGPNEAGKTAVIESIRAALSGRHDLGLTAKAVSVVLEPGAVLWASVAGDDWSASLSGAGPRGYLLHERSGSFEQFSEEACKDLLPLTNFRDLVTLGSAKAREALFRRFGTIRDITFEGLSALQQDVVRDVTPRGVADPTEVLSGMGKELRSANLRVGRALSDLEKRMETSRSQLTALAAGAEQLHALEQQYSEALAAEGAQRFSSSSELTEQRLLLRTLQARLSELAHERIEMTQRHETIAAVVAEHTAKAEAAQLRLTESAESTREDEQKLSRAIILHDIAQLQAERGITSCSLCAQTIEPAKLVDWTQRRVLSRQQTLSTIHEQQSVLRAEIAADSKEAQKLSTVMVGERQALTQKEHELELRLRQVELTIQSLEAAQHTPVTYTGPTAAELKSRIDKLRSADAMRQRLQEQATEHGNLHARREAIRAVTRIVSNTLATFVQEVQTNAEEVVNKYMPEGFRAQLHVQDSDCQWLVIGTDGVPRPRQAQSGAQRAALTLALMLGWAEPLPAKFVLLDDEDLLGLSTENTKLVLTKLQALQQAGAVAQVIVALSRPGDVPDGYTVVQLAGKMGEVPCITTE